MTRKSARLSQLDVRNVFRLLGEIVELGRDPAFWRSHMLQTLLPMIGARVGIAGEHYINPDNPADTKIVGLVSSGWSKAEEELLFAYMRAGDFAHDPFHAAASRLVHRSYTRRRRDLVSDDAWYSSPLVSEVRRNGNTDDQIYTRCKLPQSGWAHFFSPMKGWGAAPFSERDRLLVSLLHGELGRLWSQVDRGPLVALAPRLRQTLDLIFSGYSEKEIAAALNVSIHTAHDFARRLYRHFHVRGRGELISEPSCRQLLFRPALSPAYYAQNRGELQDVFP